MYLDTVIIKINGNYKQVIFKPSNGVYNKLTTLDCRQFGEEDAMTVPLNPEDINEFKELSTEQDAEFIQHLEAGARIDYSIQRTIKVA